MGYLSPDFRYDIFVSYAHGDFDHVGNSQLKTWSQRFTEKLVDELQWSLEGTELAAYLDESKRPGFGIDPTRPLTKQLVDAIRASGLLVVLMSPFYLRSDWCKREAKWFVAEMKRRQRGKGLLFIARIWPTKGEDWPPEFKGEDDETLPGFWLYDRAFHRERIKEVRPFDWCGDEAGLFGKAVISVAGKAADQLEKLLEKLKEQRRAQVALSKLAQPKGQTLYLYARDTHREIWERTSDELAQEGFKLLPSQPDPDPEVVGPEKESQARRHRVNLLKMSDALVLLRPQPGRYFDDDLMSVGVRDARNAREEGAGPLPCAVVDRASTADKGDRQRLLAVQNRIEWVEGRLPTWPAELQRRVVAAGRLIEALR